MQKAKLSLIAAALLVPAFALSAYAEDFVHPPDSSRSNSSWRRTARYLFLPCRQKS